MKLYSCQSNSQALKQNNHIILSMQRILCTTKECIQDYSQWAMPNGKTVVKNILFDAKDIWIIQKSSIHSNSICYQNPSATGNYSLKSAWIFQVTHYLFSQKNAQLLRGVKWLAQNYSRSGKKKKKSLSNCPVNRLPLSWFPIPQPNKWARSASPQWQHVASLPLRAAYQRSSLPT